MLEKIKKRDGRVAEFDSSKITAAIAKAGLATEEFDEREARKLTLRVLTLAHEMRLGDILEVEQIQDIVERVLLDSPYYKTAKAYIIYREQHSQIRKIATRANVDLVEQYIRKLDWKIKENSNMCYSLQGLNNYISSDVTAEYWLNRIYPPEIRDAHKDGDIHLHDLSLLSVYCVGWDLKDLLKQGFKGVEGKVESAPPRHLRSALGQIVNFFYTLQGEAAGAQAISNFDTLLAPFIRYDKLNYKEVKQAMQEFVFNINIPTRVGFQCLSEDTDILTPEGWKGHEDIEVGDVIKTFNIKTGKIQDQAVKKLFAKPYKGQMYNLKNEIQDQLISPGHRVVRKNLEPHNSYVLEEIEKVLESQSVVIIPTIRENDNGYNFDDIQDTYIQKIEKVEYSGVIWCPNTKNETVIARRNGKVFITGNTPFTNITMDLYVPSILKDHPVIIGGKELDNATYSEFQPEMDILNNAFAEIMMAGDAKGRVFTFPIPTYNITADFDWSNPNLENIWKMTGKYGIPYYCLEADTPVLKDDHTIVTISSLRIGDKIIDEQGKSTQVAAVFSQEVGETIHITLASGECIIATPTHRFPTKMGIKTAQELSLKDQLLRVAFPSENQSYTEKVDIVKLARVSETCQVVDISVDTPSHLFVLGSGIVSHNSNYVNSDLSPEDARSMCCRLRLDNRELLKRGGGLFGANPLTGSIGVVTINLPRIGYLANTERDFFDKLDKMIVLAENSLSIKRKILENFTEKDLYPYSKFYLRDIKNGTGLYWKNHFSTIGIVGMNEACMNFTGEGIFTKAGQSFALKVMDFIRDKMTKIQEKTGDIFNLEATPAEGTSYRLALLDKKKFPDILCANESDFQNGDDPYYTNSTQLPVNYTDDIFETLQLQDELQTKYTGGTVLHIYLGEQVNDTDAVKSLIRKIANGFRLPYFTLTPTFSVCSSHGYLKGRQERCPHCDGETEVYSRVVGYLRPVKQWNNGKQAEFHQRRTFKVA